MADKYLSRLIDIVGGKEPVSLPREEVSIDAPFSKLTDSVIRRSIEDEVTGRVGQYGRTVINQRARLSVPQRQQRVERVQDRTVAQKAEQVAQKADSHNNTAEERRVMIADMKEFLSECRAVYHADKLDIPSQKVLVVDSVESPEEGKSYILFGRELNTELKNEVAKCVKDTNLIAKFKQFSRGVTVRFVKDTVWTPSEEEVKNIMTLPRAKRRALIAALPDSKRHALLGMAKRIKDMKTVDANRPNQSDVELHSFYSHLSELITQFVCGGLKKDVLVLYSESLPEKEKEVIDWIVSGKRGNSEEVKKLIIPLESKFNELNIREPQWVYTADSAKIRTTLKVAVSDQRGVMVPMSKREFIGSTNTGTRMKRIASIVKDSVGLVSDPTATYEVADPFVIYCGGGETCQRVMKEEFTKEGFASAEDKGVYCTENTVPSESVEEVALGLGDFDIVSTEAFQPILGTEYSVDLVENPEDAFVAAIRSAVAEAGDAGMKLPEVVQIVNNVADSKATAVYKGKKLYLKY